MKKKIKILTVVSLILISGFTLGITVSANTQTTSLLESWGKILSNNVTNTNIANDIYATGTKTSLTNKDIEQTQQFYILSGMDEQSAREKAIQYVAEREALYQAAIDNGYTVTDQEVWDYIEELKDFIYNADNKEDALAIIRQFDSEEDYWNYEFTVYQKNLPIQNYVHDMEQIFMQTVTYSDESSNDIESEWQQYFEQMKAELVIDENYQVINE